MLSCDMINYDENCPFILRKLDSYMYFIINSSPPVYDLINYNRIVLMCVYVYHSVCVSQFMCITVYVCLVISCYEHGRELWYSDVWRTIYNIHI